MISKTIYIFCIPIKDAVITVQRPGHLFSVSCSPTDESLVAVAGGSTGTELFDLRNPQS